MSQLVAIESEQGEIEYFFETDSMPGAFRSTDSHKALNGLKDAGRAVASVCNDIVGQIREGLGDLAPDTVELELGVKISVEGGLPIVSKAGAEGSITVKAIWNRPT